MTDSGLIFSIVPMTCFLSPCAKAGSASRTENRSTIQRSFIFLAPCSYFNPHRLTDVFSSDPFGGPIGSTQDDNVLLNCRKTQLVMMPLRIRRWIAAVQEIILLLFFLAVIRTLWIVLFHFELFFGGKRRQVPDEVNQLPTGIGVAVFRAAAECGHASKAHSIFDDPVNIAVAKILRCICAKIGRLGVKPAADHGVSAPIVAVADGAVIGKVQPGFALHGRR